MHISELKKSKFLTKGDVTPPILVTIRGVEPVNVAAEGAPEDLKYCVQFDEVEKPLVLNSTNGQIIAGITGSEDSDGWFGKQIVLYFDPNVSFGGKLTGGIRCRAPRTQAAPATKPQPVHQSAPAAKPATIPKAVAEAVEEGDTNVPF